MTLAPLVRSLLKLVPRYLAVVAVFLALGGWAGGAKAEPAGLPAHEAALDPHDVAEVVQPAAARLPSLPGDFQRIEDGWLTLEFPGSVRERVAPLTGEADVFRARLEAELGQPVLEHVLVRIARDPDQMASLAPEGAPPFGYAAAMAYPSVRLALLSLKAPKTWEATDLGELLRHELMHLAMSDAAAGHRVPRWFDEGLAIHESGELRTARFETLLQASLSRTLLSFSDLDRAFPSEGAEVSIAYAESADVVHFLMRDNDRVRFGSLVQRIRAGVPFDRALGDAYDTDLRKLEFEWREDVGRRFGILPVLTGGGAVWGFIAVLALVAYARRRHKAKAKLAQWAREEAEADVMLTSMRQRFEREKAIPGDDDELPAGVRPGVPIVEHEGRWYTLH